MAILAWIRQSNNGVAAALASAALFGVSTPLAKLLVRDLNPWMLAGLLYLGSGLGLAGIRLWRLLYPDDQPRESLRLGSDWLWLLAAIAAGGLVAPVLLMFGLTATSAAAASLLLNLEGVFTALLAWFLFQEHYDRRIVLGMARHHRRGHPAGLDWYLGRSPPSGVLWLWPGPAWPGVWITISPGKLPCGTRYRLP